MTRTRVHPALDAADELAADGIRAAVLNARFAKPIDARRIAELAKRCGALVVVEEHSPHGGLGDAVLAALAHEGVTVPVRALGVADEVIEHGSQNEMREALGLDAAGIERAARELLGR